MFNLKQWEEYVPVATVHGADLSGRLNYSVSLEDPFQKGLKSWAVPTPLDAIGPDLTHSLNEKVRTIEGSGDTVILKQSATFVGVIGGTVYFAAYDEKRALKEYNLPLSDFGADSASPQIQAGKPFFLIGARPCQLNDPKLIEYHFLFPKKDY